MKLLNITISFVFLFGILACSDLLEEDPPGQLSTDAAFTSVMLAEQFLMSQYDVFDWSQNPQRNFQIAFSEAQISSGDMVRSRGSFTPWVAWDQPLDARNIGRTEAMWNYVYQSLGRINLFLANVEKVPTANAAEEEQLMNIRGEALFWRGYWYHLITRYYGEVVLRTEPVEDRSQADAPLSGPDEVYAIVIDDLEQAVDMLPDAWTGPAAGGRPSSWAARMVLADVYLTRENWAMARDLAGEIITNGGFALVEVDSANDFENLFGENVISTSEDIFVIPQYTDIDGNRLTMFQGRGTGNLRSPYTFNGSGWTGHLVNDDHPLIQAWSVEDRRKEFSIWDEQMRDGYRTLRRYRSPNASNAQTHGCSFHLYRLPEAYLVYAEADAMANGGTPSAQAIEYLNIVRRRAYSQPLNSASPYDYAGGGNFRDTVMVERAYEFFDEWGKRWFDLQRTNTLDFWINESYGVDVAEERRFWPIPVGEVFTNKELQDVN